MSYVLKLEVTDQERERLGHNFVFNTRGIEYYIKY